MDDLTLGFGLERREVLAVAISQKSDGCPVCTAEQFAVLRCAGTTGATWQSIADGLGIEVSTARGRYARGVAAIARELKRRAEANGG